MSIFNTKAPSKAMPTMPAKGPMSVKPVAPPANHGGEPVRHVPNKG